jgi:cyclopropane-fatty-acyl-phospholipid synthase
MLKLASQRLYGGLIIDSTWEEGMNAIPVLREQLDDVRAGSLNVVHPDGTTTHYGNREPGPTIIFRSGNILDLLSDDPLMSFGEAYMDGQVDVEGDLADLVSFAIRNGIASPKEAAQGFAGAIRRAASAGIRSFKQQKRDIAHHYDVGNDFFRLWLDESLTYSCAYFRTPTDTLEQAQNQKIEHSLHKLRLRANETLLDIGCGWGALVMQAAKKFGSRALGITLSEQQYAAARAAIETGGLQGKAEVRLQNYEALAQERTQFDKIVSIGMAEHVGKAHLAEFIHSLETLLKPGGFALLHLITGVKEGPINGWTEKYIFPGGYIPTLAEIINHVSERDLRVWDVENLGPHYQLTLDHWSDRFERCVPLIRKQFDDRFVRMWRLYLRASSASFREGTIEVHQILLSRGQPRNLSLTREDLYSHSDIPGVKRFSGAAQSI